MGGLSDRFFGVYSPDEGQQYSFHDRAQAEERVRTELENGKLSFLLRGEKVKGSFALVRMADRKNWLLIKHKDRFVAKTDLTAQTRSVLSNASVEEMKSVPAHRIAAERLVVAGPSERLPATLAPMQARATTRSSRRPRHKAKAQIRISSDQ